MSGSASIKQNWGEEVYLHGNHRKLHGSELLPWLLTAMKTGLCIESESLGSQSLTDWLRNKAAPPLGGQELQIPALSLIPHPRRRAEGLFPQARHTPTGSQPFRLSMAAAKFCCSWSQRNVEQSLEFFSAEKQVLLNSKFHSGLLSRHIVCRSLQSRSLP